MADPILAAARSGAIVLWEEAARDGAQARTLLLGPQRVALARAQGALFGVHGPQHLIFAAGFPAICPEEFDAVRQVALGVDNCSVACHGRSTREDIDLCLRALQGACHGRITLIMPTSERLAHSLLHRPLYAAVEHTRGIVRYALDRSVEYPIDVALLDASHAAPSFVADVAADLAAEGVAVVKLCDSMGELFPAQLGALVRTVQERIGAEGVLGVHLHNDFGLALANNLEAVRLGVRVVACAWLGLGERNGLAATEQLLFALGYQPQTLADRLGGNAPVWLTPPDLRGLVPIAQQVSQATGVPLKVTDPHVGTGVNALATGTAFIAPEHFRPYDPETVLGVPRRLLLTHLASQRVLLSVAEELGRRLTPEQAAAALTWVKSYAYARGSSVIPLADFDLFVSGLQALEARPAAATALASLSAQH